MNKAREDRLYKGLTAQARARLAMADLKAGREPSPRVSWLTPDAQREKFSRLLCSTKKGGLGNDLAAADDLDNVPASKVVWHFDRRFQVPIGIG